MMARPKDIGTAAETAVVRALRRLGWPHAERRALAGAQDLGDITGTPGVVWEVKGGQQTRHPRPSDATVAQWLLETDIERTHARADIGVLVIQRHGVGPANAHLWWAYMSVGAVAILRLNLVNPVADTWGGPPVRMLLGDACTLLRDAGYGQPLPEEVTR